MNASKKFTIGFSSFSKAHSFIFKNNLWYYVVIPGVMNMIAFYFFFKWVRHSAASIVEGVFEVDCVDSEGIWGLLCPIIDGAGGVLEWMLAKFIYLALIIIYGYIYKTVVLMLYSPFLSILVEKVDQIERQTDEPFRLEQFLKDTVRGVVIAFRNLFYEGLWVIALFILAFIPVLNFIQPILGWIISAYFLGFSMMDYSLEIKRVNARSSIGYIKENRSLAIGIGTICQIIFLIPFIGWMIAPTYGAVAAYFSIQEVESETNKLLE